MNDNQPSITSMITAYIRAYHSMHAINKIFDDFLAYDLIPEEIRAQIEHYLTGDKQLNNSGHSELQSDKITAQASLLRINNIIARARYTEDTLEKAIRQGVKQYIILGAGLDTFAFRRPDLMEQVEVFEIDHPSTQGFKLIRIAELGWKHPIKLHFIPIDFTKENLETVITRLPSYDPSVKSFFSWLGVTMYLTQEEVFATLRSISKVSPGGSIVVFNYSSLDAFVPDKLSLDTQKYREICQKMGEPITTGFNPSVLAEDLGSLGLRLCENLSSEDIEKLYFEGRTDGYHISEYSHFACAIIK
jgi:methyltransferase (TIGR00027 family)